MNTKHIPHPVRRRVKRATRKLARAGATARRSGAPAFAVGATITALRSQRRAGLAYHSIRARLAALAEIEPPAGWQDRASDHARREGIIR